MRKFGRSAGGAHLISSRRNRLRYGLSALALAGVLAVSACTPDPDQPEFTPYSPRDQADRDKYGTITGANGISLLASRHGNADSQQGGGGGGIGVNAYLWRGALETVDFLPLLSADPFGGLIITDWYQPAQSPDERLRLQILIRDTVLRADGVKVTVLRQQRTGRGDWLDAPSDPATATQIEDKILTRARELRISGLPS
ncbi:protein of unknown function [Arboricoccus pini]|uniref:DUF3576 domain-containing protein n=1 Tax=Arboricoccus pini TaxID=1963835 RepID=A0A212RTP9_9PROT|nr:DUF3576 domain-containing protein [Arboricoccus pini]SNB75883.1 protein of unknown function [Arboricoccus pini]